MSGYPIPDNPEDYRQCIACEYICSDDRLKTDDDFACPSCKRRGHWTDEVDWPSRDRAMDRLARLNEEMGLE